MFPMQAVNNFNTDYWNASWPNLYTSATTGEAPAQGHPALPALWWLGALIALIIIRVAYEHMD